MADLGRPRHVSTLKETEFCGLLLSGLSSTPPQVVASARRCQAGTGFPLAAP